MNLTLLVKGTRSPREFVDFWLSLRKAGLLRSRSLISYTHSSWTLTVYTIVHHQTKKKKTWKLSKHDDTFDWNTYRVQQREKPLIICRCEAYVCRELKSRYLEEMAGEIYINNLADIYTVTHEYYSSIIIHFKYSQYFHADAGWWEVKYHKWTRWSTSFFFFFLNKNSIIIR